MSKAKRRPKLIKVALWVALAFFLTFIGRCCYEVFFTNRDIVVTYSQNYYNQYLDDVGFRYSLETSNVASAKVVQKDTTGSLITVEQKYEKVADLSSDTVDFDTDNKNLRTIITENEAVIQMENFSGLKGNRSLVMSIGVMPDNFDALVEQVQQIGEIKSFNVTKVDKTGEYRGLIAQQETLKKTRESYVDIKKMAGEIKDLLMLEEKILEVEAKLQDLGVDLGIFSTEYSFCTINFNLLEATKHTISVRFVLSCAKSSLSWTLTAFAVILFVVAAALFALWIILLLLNNIKLPPKATEDGSDMPENKE